MAVSSASAVWVRQHCEVLPCRELADVPAERRGQLVEWFGRDGAESICLSQRPGHVLWADDCTLGIVARLVLNAAPRVVWTQVGLSYAATTGVLPQSKYAIATAQLIGLGYESLRIDSEAIVASGILASWSTSDWRFARALDLFRPNRMSDWSRLTNAKAFLLRLFYHVSCPATRKSVVFALLERLNTSSMVGRLGQELSFALIPDHASSLAARNLFNLWLKRRWSG